MRTRTKTVCWGVLTAVALILGAIMLMAWREREKIPDWQRNEVISCLTRYFNISNPPSTPYEMYYVERTDISRKEVYFLNKNFLVQAYTIEGDSVKDYRWDPGLYEKDVGYNFDIDLLRYWFQRALNPSCPLETHLEKKLVQSRYTIPPIKPQPLAETGSNVIITTAISVDCTWNFLIPSPPSSPSALKLLTWSGMTSEEPGIIMDFCTSVITEAGKPEYAKNNPLSWKSWSPERVNCIFPWQPKGFHAGYRIYPSYLRAIPLHTKEEREQAKDIPLIDDEENFYPFHILFSPQRVMSFSEECKNHLIAFAVNSPYTLIPVPDKDSPFPVLNKPYEPGHDKVRVKRDFGVYFLIETFKGEGWTSVENGKLKNGKEGK